VPEGRHGFLWMRLLFGESVPTNQLSVFSLQSAVQPRLMTGDRQLATENWQLSTDNRKKNKLKE
jgi:hypothetical protein